MFKVLTVVEQPPQRERLDIIQSNKRLAKSATFDVKIQSNCRSF